MINAGKDKGQTGVIKRVVKSQNRVIVEGKNLDREQTRTGAEDAARSRIRSPTETGSSVVPESSGALEDEADRMGLR